MTGLGVGWRPEIAGVVAGLPGRPGLGFCEVIAESLGVPRTVRASVRLEG
ncbi:hypothetical protein ACFQH9_21790 [Pseudonocardia lutea]|uniref:Uncharacterized protein n=1 Tax=Pseudonocardia lutea TaxID=2172015 RepID=A0ABW1IE23_9PSEU